MADPFINFAIALGVGLLVGLQRERAASVLAGVRTFALLTVFGALCGHLAGRFGPFPFGAGFVAVAGLIWVGNVPRQHRSDYDPGLTTEVAMLVMFGVGALAGLGERELAVVLGGTTAVLLHLRPQLHAFAGRMGDTDMRAMMQFVVVALIILPVLPDASFGPFDVFNPRRMWWMVVLITGISLGSYVAYKLLGSRAGAVLGGVLGGLISSTATTVAYARRTRTADGRCPIALATMVILIAGAVVFGRVLVLAGVTAPAQFKEMAPPLVVMLGLTAGLAVVAWWRSRGDAAVLPPPSNPTELRLALTFGVLFAIVLLAVAAAKHGFGDRGLYVVAVLSGLTDMDAITLSTAQLAHRGEVAGHTAGRVILVAGLANVVFKGGMVAVLGDRALLRQVAVFFGLALAGGLAVLALT